MKKASHELPADLAEMIADHEKVIEPGKTPRKADAQGPNGHHEEQKKPLPTLLSKREFLAGFKPPDFLVDGVLQRRFIYSLTGGTGHAKTAIALLIAQLVSSRGPAVLGTHRVQKGRVIYFVGENPDDVRMRLIGADAKRDDDTDDQISFLPGVFSVEGMRQKLASEMDKTGGVELIIVDTSAAYFLGNDEISNSQMGGHARMLRTLTTLPGGPCVLVLCHPIKHVTEPDQLLPRGGGAFLAEVDGNLTAWRDDDVITLHYTGKIRGPGFEPITFKLEKITTTALTDSQGRLIPTVRAVPISEHEEEAETRSALDDENRVLLALKTDPDRSIGDLARACHWTLQSGEPHKSKVHRLLGRMEKSKPKLVAKDRGDRWKLTDVGRAQADRTEAQFGGKDFRVAMAEEFDLRGAKN